MEKKQRRTISQVINKTQSQNKLSDYSKSIAVNIYYELSSYGILQKSRAQAPTIKILGDRRKKENARQLRKEPEQIA